MSWRRRRRLRPLSFSDLAAFLLLAGILLALVYWLGPGPLSGGARVIDGDSLRLDGRIIRLHGIDAPELHQTCRDRRGKDYPCGRRAARYLRALIAGAEVECRIVDEDRYRRFVSICTIAGRELNRAMVEAGWALAYRRHSFAYVAVENAARRAGKGVWQGRFVKPQAWRAQHPR